MQEFYTQMLAAKAWPFQEAERLLKRLGDKLPAKGYVLFETGYGPSGLPHIGTFGEVVRTSMVRFAFEQISGMPTKMFCVSDDMDGMRKIPDTIPNRAEYEQYMDLPLTQIPDPFGTHKSYGDHMNSRLQSFLKNFGFDFEFKSASECYKTGVFDEYLLKMLDNYEKIMAIMLPTLGEERQKTYSPFLPISPSTGKVLQVPMLSINKEKGEITYQDLDGTEVTQSVLGGNCKLQWKPDFGMRWAALDVDFEMYGKDHLANGPIYTKICQTIGGKGPVQMNYELFLDKDGQKISKTKGNGISMDEWLRYAPVESLALYMYQQPGRAKRLHFDVIPKAMDEYLQYKKNFVTLAPDQKEYYANPIYHIDRGQHDNDVPKISYSLLLNLVGACNTEDADVLKKYIQQFDAQANLGQGSLLERMLARAINYYDDFIKPFKVYRLPAPQEAAAIKRLHEELEKVGGNHDADALQTLVFTIGKEFSFELKDWFRALYEILLGASQGPKLGSFIALYGVEQTRSLLEDALAGKLVK